MGAWGIAKYGIKPVKVDAITFWSDRLERLGVEIAEAQARCRKRPVPSAFVTLNSRTAQVQVASSLHHHDETTWQVEVAPEPKEVIWPSLRMRAWERAARTLVLWAAYFVLMVFFIIPVAAVQALIQVPRLAQVRILGDIVTAPFVRQVLEAIIPGLVLAVFLALLPTLLAFMCRLSGFVSESQVDFGVCSRYFYFQVVTIFIGSVISGSVLNQLQQLVNNPTSLISALGFGIPQTASFFINYILVAGIGKTGLRHLRIVGLVVYMLLSKIASTPRARARLWADQFTTYGPSMPLYSMAFLLGLVFCCINPIIAPVVLVYMSFATISERYNALYVFKTPYESGGRLWKPIFTQLIVSLYVMQVVMIILLNVKQFRWALLAIPAPVATLAFHLASLRLFARPWSMMSAHDAALLDQKDVADRGGEVMTAGELRAIKDMYLSPVFKVQTEDVAELLREAQITSRRVDGEQEEDIVAELEEDGYHSADEGEGADTERGVAATSALRGERPHVPILHLAAAANGAAGAWPPNGHAAQASKPAPARNSGRPGGGITLLSSGSVAPSPNARIMPTGAVHDAAHDASYRAECGMVNLELQPLSSIPQHSGAPNPAAARAGAAGAAGSGPGHGSVR